MLSYQTKNWADSLPKDVYNRLANCCTRKSDLLILLETLWNWAQNTGHYDGYTKEDHLINILNLLDANGQEFITDLTVDEWTDLIH